MLWDGDRIAGVLRPQFLAAHCGAKPPAHQTVLLAVTVVPMKEIDLRLRARPFALRNAPVNRASSAGAAALVLARE